MRGISKADTCDTVQGLVNIWRQILTRIHKIEHFTWRKVRDTPSSNRESPRCVISAGGSYPQRLSQFCPNFKISNDKFWVDMCIVISLYVKEVLRLEKSQSRFMTIPESSSFNAWVEFNDIFRGKHNFLNGKLQLHKSIQMVNACTPCLALIAWRQTTETLTFRIQISWEADESTALWIQ